MGLIERESQLAGLHQYADEASHAQGRLVLVSGEAGIGKSALLEDFAQQSADARWLWAGCDGLFTPAALGPLLDIAAQLGGELLSLCQADAKRDQLYSALLGQLSDLESLTVIAIEDIHWADEATLDLLSYRGRRCTTGPRHEDRRNRTASADRRQSLFRYRGAASGKRGPAGVGSRCCPCPYQNAGCAGA